MRDLTFRYEVQMTLKEARVTPAGWPHTKRQDPSRPAHLLGKPTSEKLARYVEDFNTSRLPGGCNDQLTEDRYQAVSACIVDTHNNRTVVAEWQA